MNSEYVHGCQLLHLKLLMSHQPGATLTKLFGSKILDIPDLLSNGISQAELTPTRVFSGVILDIPDLSHGISQPDVTLKRAFCG